MASLFKSELGKKEVLAMYDQKLEELNISYQSKFVETSYGKTHILITGDASNPPLILVHGSNGCAPIALECYPNLSSKYQVFAIDVVAQPTKSAETRLSMKDDSYGKWVNEVIDKLGLEQVTLAGFSLGGLIILKTLIYNDKNIKNVVIASPAYIVNGNPFRALFKIFIPMKRYMKTKKVEFIEKFLAALFTDRDEFAVRFLSKVFLHFEMDFTPVPVIKKQEAQGIKTPITLLASGQDIIFPGKKMLKRAKKIFPSLRKTVFLEDSKHVQNEAGNKVVEQLLFDLL
ncbi:MAG: alpha/beta hydrolase [Saprospiraceae bacterium]|nr:alpha/beta hydrolase [Saprospiraceae bacterium]